MESWTVYCHAHLDSGRHYVGITKHSILHRWHQHCAQAKAAKKTTRSHFWAAIRKYGKEAFSHKVLETCPTLEEANAAEDRWIEELETRNPEKGFNLARGGQHTPHEKQNPWDRPEFREKMKSVALPKLIAAGSSPEARAASKAALATPEGKAALSRGVSCHYEDPANRARQSESVRSLHQDPEIHAQFQKGLRTADANKRAKTHCRRGHEFTPENTRIDEGGWRQCRQCAADRYSVKAEQISKEHRESKTACLNGHPYSDGSFKLSKSGTRVCLHCVVRTHCKAGHDLTEDNVVTVSVSGKSARLCLECRRIRGRINDARRRARKKARSGSFQIQVDVL